MTEILIASTLGGACSALRYHKCGGLQMFRVFVSSSLLAYFAGGDFSAFVNGHFSYGISVSASCFLTAYAGSTILDRFIMMIRAYKITRVSNDD